MIRLGIAALGVFGVILTIRALITGAASASGDDITRSEEPLAYWTTIVAAILITSFLFWKAFHSS
jgi:hypothetical protein